MILFLTIFSVLITLFLKSNAQPQQLSVDADFSSKPLKELIKYIEEKDGIKFFYLNKWIDSIRVDQNEVPSYLNVILDKSLGNTKITYFNDYQGNIVLTQKYRIEPGQASFVTYQKYDSIPEVSSGAVSSFIRNDQAQPGAGKVNSISVTIGTNGSSSKSGKSIISGIIREDETGQPVIGGLVYLDDLSLGTATDKYGYYVLSVPDGSHLLRVKYAGRRDLAVRINVIGNGTLNLAMEEKLLELRGVVISAERDYNVRGLQIGLEKVDVQTIKQLSSTMGEGDLMKTALLLPGVKTVGEGAPGFNVRGGGTDQNLILMDGSPVFNSSHIFGFFSVFNPDVVRDFKLYKSGIPSQYGGRLSSVLDVTIKSGDMHKFSVYGGISPVSGRITVEGPIIKNKASFLISSRGSYSDWVLRRTKVPSLLNSNASFMDFNFKADVNLNESDRLSFSGYLSGDNFRLNSDTLYTYGNRNLNINYKHNLSEKLYGTISAIYSDNSYSVSSQVQVPHSFDLTYSIKYFEGRNDYTWFYNMNHKVTFGANVIKYKVNPGSLSPAGTGSIIRAVKIPDQQALETGVYLNDEYTVNDALSISYGLRYSGFLSMGPSVAYTYQTDAPRALSSRIDSAKYARNQISSFRGGPEFRFLLRYKTGPANSVKISYTKMYQYLQMISNTAAISPTDVWKLSGPNLPAQSGRQFSAGFFQYLFSDKILSSVEAYYKLSDNILEYRGGTLILMNPDLEIDLLSGKGKSYGIEFLVKKEYGAFNGWLSYTWSRSMLKVDSKYIVDRINDGKYFPSNYDKPHDITLVANYRFSRIHSISTTMTYSTGRPITYPVGKYQFRGREFINYSNRNEYRIPDYFRWDVAVNLEGILRSRSIMQNSLSVSVYNITGRDNAYSIFFKNDGSKKIRGYKLSVFSQPVVSVTYNFRF